MSIRSLLETFDVRDAATTNTTEAAVDPSIENVRATAFEAGYASGWDDAKASNDQARVRVQAEFERNVEAISFTYHDAIDRVRSELKSFLDALLNEFFPSTLPLALREHIRSELISAAEAQISSPVEIVMSPDCSDLVSEFADGEFAIGISLIEDKSLAENQVFVRIADIEREVNLTPLISELKFQMSAMNNIEEVTHNHG